MQGRLVSYPLTLVLSHYLNETRIRTKTSSNCLRCGAKPQRFCGSISIQKSEAIFPC